MLARKCDICGKLFEIPEKGKTDALMFIKRDENGWTQGDILDLCPACMRATKKMIKDRAPKTSETAEGTVNVRQMARSL